jgi:hypothetical protein
MKKNQLLIDNLRTHILQSLENLEELLEQEDINLRTLRIKELEISFTVTRRTKSQLLHRLRCNLQQAPTYPKQIKIQTEMKALLLIALIIYTSLSLIHRSKRYSQIPYPTNKQKYIYITLQSLQIIPLIPLETLIPRIPTH